MAVATAPNVIADQNTDKMRELPKASLYREHPNAPAPYGAIPTVHQVNWQRLELYAFVHFGLNTFTGREWGYGDENPEIFDPTKFDADTIVKTFKTGGMKGMIYTAKHHDGWCSWPTKSTEHNITKSPFQQGKADIVRDFAKACKKQGLHFGTYLSPWDRNHAEYGSEGYIKSYYKQIEELLTNYGPIFEIWFDGANGGDGYYGGAREKRKIGDASTYYNFEQIVKNIRKIQPQTIIWGAGHSGDARWGGSEKGRVNYPCWPTIDSKLGGSYGTGYRNGDRWVPAEGDTTINHAGWFWHKGQSSRVKSPERLLRVWFESVGRGANLILNLAPDRTGRLDPADVKALMGFKALRDRLYASDFARGAKGKADNVRGKDRAFGPQNLFDGNLDTYWASDDDVKTPSIEIKLRDKATFDVVRVREQIRLGQRVEGWAVDAKLNGKWQEVLVGSAIGNQAMLKLKNPVTTDELRLRITKSPACPAITEFSLLKLPDITQHQPPTLLNQNELDRSSWRIQTSFDSKNHPVAHAIDGNPHTIWCSHNGQSRPHGPPQSVIIDFGKTESFASIEVLPRQDGISHAVVDRYAVQWSMDGKDWTDPLKGEFSNIRNNPVAQRITLPQAVTARHLKFTALRVLEKDNVTVAEIRLFRPE